MPLVETKLLVKIIQKAGGKKIRFTFYEGAGHVEAWERAYDDPETWRWLFSNGVNDAGQ